MPLPVVETRRCSPFPVAQAADGVPPPGTSGGFEIGICDWLVNVAVPGVGGSSFWRLMLSRKYNSDGKVEELLEVGCGISYGSESGDFFWYDDGYDSPHYATEVEKYLRHWLAVLSDDVKRFDEQRWTRIASKSSEELEEEEEGSEEATELRSSLLYLRERQTVLKCAFKNLNHYRVLASHIADAKILRQVFISHLRPDYPDKLQYPIN